MYRLVKTNGDRDGVMFQGEVARATKLGDLVGLQVVLDLIQDEEEDEVIADCKARHAQAKQQSVQQQSAEAGQHWQGILTNADEWRLDAAAITIPIPHFESTTMHPVTGDDDDDQDDDDSDDSTPIIIGAPDKT